MYMNLYIYARLDYRERERERERKRETNIHIHNTHTTYIYDFTCIYSEYSNFSRKCARFNQLAVRIRIFFIIHEHLFLVF